MDLHNFTDKEDLAMARRNTFEISQRWVALVTGAALIIMAVTAFWVTPLFDRVMTLNGNDHLNLTERYLRQSILGWLIIFVSDIFVAWGLHIFLKMTSQSLSLLTAWFRLVYVFILGVAIANLIIGLALAKGAYPYMKAIENDQLSVLIIFFINGFKEIWSFGLIIFGLHLSGLSYLVFKSGFIPKVWSIMLGFAAFGYILTNLGSLLSDSYENFRSVIDMIFILPMILGEMGVAVWLLLKGGRSTGLLSFSNSFSDPA